MLREVAIVNFRNIERVDLSPAPGVNFIFGDNGAGKSSLLEAVDFLSRGRTFRTRLSRTLIREGNRELTVSAALEGGARLGSRRRVSGPGVARAEIRMGGREAASQADMAAALPVTVFHTGAQRQAQSEAGHWRNVLDWGVFHVKPAFRAAWRNYRGALRQRNTLLREPLPNGALGQWNEQLAKQAQILDSARSDYTEKLIAEVEASAAAQGKPLRVAYFRGWPAEEDLGRLLDKAETDDRRVGYTRHGPHRATLRLSWERTPASERASRGEQKNIAALLMLAQVRLFTELTGRRCVVMVDDLAAEFDERRQNWLLEELERTGQQVFVTSAEASLATNEARVFRMEGGRLSD